MNNISYQCPTEFNVVTTLKSCDEYKKELQESMDPLKYKFDLQPGPMCYMPGQAFQGLRMAAGRMPPPQLLDVEMTLHSMPLKEQDNRYVIKDIHNAKPPSMPKILSNRLIVPDCKDILGWQRTKIRNRIDTPQFSHRMEKMGTYSTDYMRPGRDTRAEMRDAFRKYENQKTKNNSSSIYGVGKYDSRTLKPGTNPECTNADSDLGCMHVYGPDAVRTSTVIDPTMTLKDLAANSNISGTVGGRFTNALGIGSGTASANATMGPSQYAQESRRVAETINPDIPYTDLIKKQFVKNGCNARFYGYTPGSC